MKVLIIGGDSSLAKTLKPFISKFSEILTAGRHNCDIFFDLEAPLKDMILPDNIDVVIHTASHFGGKSAEEILRAENVNVLGTIKLCHKAQQAKAKHFIYISSIFSCLKENSKQFSIYALSKKQAEEASRFYCSRFSLPLTILRPSQIYGNENRFRLHQPFFYDMVDKAEKSEDIVLYGKNDALRNFIHIDDLVQIIAKVIQFKPEGTYSCTYPTDYSYTQIAKSAFQAFNTSGKVSFLKDKEDIPDNIFEKDDSLYKKIEFYPEISMEEGMKKIASYRKTLV